MSTVWYDFGVINTVLSFMRSSRAGRIFCYDKALGLRELAQKAYYLQ